MPTFKELVKSIPVVGNIAQRVYNAIINKTQGARPFPGSSEYWEERYSGGGNSGVGSYSKFAQFKAEVLNDFVAANNIDTVIEFGSGDGSQLMHASYPHYIGFDVSTTAVALCRQRFGGDTTKSFYLLNSSSGEKADLALSLDVIYHLIEDSVFEDHMRRLFNAATAYVIIYSSNTDQNDGYENSHVKHRKFTRWVAENAVGWSLIQHIPNRYPYDGNYNRSSFADFYVYRRSGVPTITI